MLRIFTLFLKANRLLLIQNVLRPAIVAAVRGKKKLALLQKQRKLISAPIKPVVAPILVVRPSFPLRPMF